MNRGDARYIGAEERIRNAFLELVAIHGFQGVTASMIIGVAKVNRSTFYAHHQDKWSLMEAIEDDFMEGLATTLAHTESLEDRVGAAADYLDHESKVAALLLGDGGDPAFAGRFSAFLAGKWEHTGMAALLSVPTPYASAALVGMISGILRSGMRANGS